VLYPWQEPEIDVPLLGRFASRVNEAFGSLSLSPPDWGSLSRMSSFSAVTGRSSFEPAQVYKYIYIYIYLYIYLYIYIYTHIPIC